MIIKTRNQNPVISDNISLRLFTQNLNNFANVYSIEGVEIYKKHNEEYCLVESLAKECVTNLEDGTYELILNAEAPLYSIGEYRDVWLVKFRENDEIVKVNQDFKLNPDLWITSSFPVVYSFGFDFTPNTIRHGSVKWLKIQIIPNVPRATELENYYRNIAISANLKITIEQQCGPCVPEEQDLRMIVEDELVDTRDKVFSYYKLDTREMDCGVYNVWFTLEFAGNIEISPKMQFQIYD